MLNTLVRDGACQREKVGTCAVRQTSVVNRASVTKSERKGSRTSFARQIMRIINCEFTGGKEMVKVMNLRTAILACPGVDVRESRSERLPATALTSDRVNTR
jgi:hypothetical protein